jgi:hypothetical protein
MIAQAHGYPGSSPAGRSPVVLHPNASHGPPPPYNAAPAHRHRLGSATATIDLSSGSLARWWARRCIRTSPVPVDQLAPALDTLHAETLDDIRADRPV